MFKNKLGKLLVVVAAFVLGGIVQPFSHLPSLAQQKCQFFPETSKEVCGRFMEYWDTHGGLAQNGLPLTGEFIEISQLDGKQYDVQYFERAVFEKHPENAPPYDVLLSQLGTFQFKSKYPNGDPTRGGGTTPPLVVTSHGPGRSATFRLEAGWYGVSLEVSYGAGEHLNHFSGVVRSVDGSMSFSIPEVETQPGTRAVSGAALGNIKSGEYYIEVFTTDDPQWMAIFTPPTAIP